MQIDCTTGCVCDSLTVDRTETIDMEMADLKKVCHKLVDFIDDVAMLQRFIQDVCESYGKYDEPQHCEECGDTIYSSHLKID